MKIHSINNQWNNIAFRSGYPTFQSAGHLTFCGNKTPIYENTNPSDRQMSTKEGDNISFTGSPFNRDNHDSVSFKGAPIYRHCADEDKEGCQPIRPQSKMPPTGGVLLYSCVDTSGNVLDIKG